jgi:xanthine dehydrogenase accessory factor
MREVLGDIQAWTETVEKGQVYLGTVTYIEGSAVRGAGATMAISPEGELAGSVSGGCIESTVYSEAFRLREKGGSRAFTFCSTDDDLVGAPAPCGGTVGVVVYPAAGEVARALAERLKQGKDERWGVITGGEERLTGVSFALDEQDQLRCSAPPDGNGIEAATADALSRSLRNIKEPGIVSAAGLKAFFMYRPAVPHLCIAGGSHIGSALLRVAREIGWRVSVVDPREIFAEERRFAAADCLLHEWPAEGFRQLGLDETAAVAAVTHNEAMDDEAMAEALQRGCYYAGVLGSTRTFAQRKERLRERGFSEEQLQRLHGPIGLDIKAATPEEIALSVMAEVVYTYRSRFGKRA